MSFLSVVVILFGFIVAALLGIWIAFLLMRPARRKIFRENVLIKINTLVLISLLFFTLIFCASTLYRASAYYRVVLNQFESSKPVILAGSLVAQQADDWKNNKSAITKEIWWQQMMLPGSDSTCSAGDQEICSLIRQVGLSVTSRWNSYLVFLGIGLAGVFGFIFYSIWILKLKYEEDTESKKILRPRPKSKARR